MDTALFILFSELCMKHFSLPKALRSQQGFTLIELLVVIGILAVLLAIVLVAINPARQFSQANNTKRSSDINAILNAVQQYAADNRGTLPAGITATASAISAAGVGQAFCEALVTDYLAALPSDPTGGALAGEPVDEADCATYGDTGYEIWRSATNNRISVSAPNAELGVVLQVIR